MSKSNLNQPEVNYIQEREDAFARTIDLIKNSMYKFKEGDFLIAYAKHWDHRVMRYVDSQVTNSYGAPKKFTVVHVDKNGIPYIKELNKRGTPVGTLLCPIRSDSAYGDLKPDGYAFEVDPDYADSIIMDNEGSFDATHIHKTKSDTFKEITQHNKSLKVKIRNTAELIEFLKTLKVGNVYYKSIKTYFTIISLDPIPTTHNGTRIVEHKSFGTAQNSKGKTIQLDHTTFSWYSVYTGQPRSYNELKDPK